MSAGARRSLSAFLAAARTALDRAIKEQKPIDFVVGNESADLDSICSTLLYAYLTTSASRPPKIYIPLLNIPRQDIAIRPELLWLLPQTGLHPSQLLTLTDIPGLLDPSSSPAPQEQPSKSSPPSPHLTTFTLVDHNALTGPLASHYASSDADTPRATIAACIDHHVDEHVVPSSASPRVIETAGSCTSLVLRECRTAWDSLSIDTVTSSVPAQAQADAFVGLDDAGVRKGWDAQVARLAIASVLIDTAALNDRGKTEEVDIQAVEYLEARIQVGLKGGESWDQDGFYRALVAAKNDLEGLSVDDVLRKDFKEWDSEGGKGAMRLGIAACVRPLAWLVEKSDRERADEPASRAVLSAVREFAEKRKLDVVVLGTAFSGDDEEFRRELMVWTLSEAAKGVMERFVAKAEGVLGLREWSEAKLDFEEEVGECRIWWVGDVSKSRKQYAPLLRDAMKDVVEEGKL